MLKGSKRIDNNDPERRIERFLAEREDVVMFKEVHEKLPGKSKMAVFYVAPKASISPDNESALNEFLAGLVPEGMKPEPVSLFRLSTYNVHPKIQDADLAEELKFVYRHLDLGVMAFFGSRNRRLGRIGIGKPSRSILARIRVFPNEGMARDAYEGKIAKQFIGLGIELELRDRDE